MAIDKVGGEYIIKGNSTNPALTPSGQSWANLLTQEKYKLWQVANQEAMRQLQTEQLTAQQRQQRVDQLREDLLRQRNATIKGINDLKAKQLTTQGASDVATWKAQTERDKPRAIRSSSGTGTGRSRGRNKYGSLLEYTNELMSIYQQLKKNFDDMYKEIPDTLLTSAAYREMRFQDFTPKENEALEEWADTVGIPKEQIIIQQQQLGALQQEISKIQETPLKDQAEELQKINNRYRSGGGSGSGSGGSVTTYTKGKPVTQAPVTDYSGQIKALEDRLKLTEEELLGLKNVDIPSGNSIERTRKVMKDQFGIGNYQEPEAESPVIPTEPVVAEPVAQPEVQPTQETTDELMSQKDAEAYLDNLFASRLTQQGTQQNFQRPKATSVLPQEQPEVQPRILPPGDGLAVPDRLPPAQRQATVEEILELNETFPQPETSSIDRINQVRPPEDYGDITIDGVSVASLPDERKLIAFTPEIAIQTLNSMYGIALEQEGATQQSVADAIQITALELLNTNSKYRLSDPEKYDKYRDAILDYVFKFLNPNQARAFDTAKEVIASKNLDEMNIYKHVENATKEDNANLLRILQTNWGALETPKQINEQSKEAQKALDNAYKSGSITEDKYQTYLGLLAVWTMIGKQLMNKSFAEQDIILDKRFTTNEFGG